MNTKRVKTYRLIIKGKVQGVSFRYWFSKLAISLGLNGYIKNLNNRYEVEVIIQGKIIDIIKITEKCKNGPELAMVEDVISKQIFNKVQYNEFKIIY